MMTRRLTILLGGLLLSISSPSFAQDMGVVQNGFVLARTVCAQCHAVRRGQRVSPNRHAPSFTTIARTPGMTPLAIRVALRTGHREMPNLVVKDEEIDDLVAYLHTLK